MTKTEDLLNNPRPHHIRNDRVDLNKVIVMVQETMNPFDVNLHLDKLYNTGTRQLQWIQLSFLLNILKNAAKELKIFIQKCSQDSRQFEKPIKRQKITFISMLNARFWRILCVLQRKVDMTQVLNYPLAPVPLSLKHVDGMMIHTSKSALLTYLKTKKAMQPQMKLMFKSLMQHFIFTRISQLILVAQQNISGRKFCKGSES